MSNTFEGIIIECPGGVVAKIHPDDPHIIFIRPDIGVDIRSVDPPIPRKKRGSSPTSSGESSQSNR